MSKLIINIPFSGFYQTNHDVLIDNEYAGLFTDSSGETYDDISDEAWILIGQESFRPYAEGYVSVLEEQLELDLEFDDLVSPKEYNYSTDRIFCSIPEEKVQMMRNQVDDSILSKDIESKCKSYDGYVSIYSEHLDDWEEDVTKWDHNELGILLSSWALSLDKELDVDEERLSDIASEAVHGTLSDGLIDLAEKASQRREQDELGISSP